jgi:hypothetical protein
VRTPDSYSGYCEKTTFRKFGYRIRKIGIYDNFSGTVIGWCSPPLHAKLPQMMVQMLVHQSCPLLRR